MKDSSSGDHHHVNYEYKSSCPRGHWRPAEDEKLRQLVEQYGAQNWNSIAEKLQGRSGICSYNIISNGARKIVFDAKKLYRKIKRVLKFG